MARQRRDGKLKIEFSPRKSVFSLFLTQIRRISIEVTLGTQKTRSNSLFLWRKIKFRQIWAGQRRCEKMKEKHHATKRKKKKKTKSVEIREVVKMENEWDDIGASANTSNKEWQGETRKRGESELRLFWMIDCNLICAIESHFYYEEATRSERERKKRDKEKEISPRFIHNLASHFIYVWITHREYRALLLSKEQQQHQRRKGWWKNGTSLWWISGSWKGGKWASR